MGWEETNAKCQKCKCFDPVATVEWRSCTHPKRYTIDESMVLSIDVLDDSIDLTDFNLLDYGLPVNYTDNNCPVSGD